MRVCPPSEMCLDVGSFRVVSRFCPFHPKRCDLDHRSMKRLALPALTSDALCADGTSYDTRPFFQWRSLKEIRSTHRVVDAHAITPVSLSSSKRPLADSTVEEGRISLLLDPKQRRRSLDIHKRSNYRRRDLGIPLRKISRSSGMDRFG